MRMRVRPTAEAAFQSTYPHVSNGAHVVAQAKPQWSVNYSANCQKSSFSTDSRRNQACRKWRFSNIALELHRTIRG